MKFRVAKNHCLAGNPYATKQPMALAAEHEQRFEAAVKNAAGLYEKAVTYQILNTWTKSNTEGDIEILTGWRRCPQSYYLSKIFNFAKSLSTALVSSANS